ncbi:MAG: hypothetical protein ABIH85_03885 [Candidatus Omnitrophota bacterium]
MKENVLNSEEMLRGALEFFNDALMVKDSVNDDTSRRLTKNLEQYAFFAFFHMWKALKNLGSIKNEKRFLEKTIDDFLGCIYVITELRLKGDLGALASMALKSKVEAILIVLTRNSN